MADILSLVFRKFISKTSVKKEIAFSAPSAETSSVLMVGNLQVSHSLLMLSAFTAASDLGIRVVFFTKNRIKGFPVPVQKCFPTPSPETLKKITFTYPRSLGQLLKEVASLHESPTLPLLIIIDKLGDFVCPPSAGSYCGFQSSRWSSIARLVALLCDTAAFITQTLEQRGSNSGPCRILASFLSGTDTGHASRNVSATDPFLEILDRYFQVRCSLNENTSNEAQAEEMWHILLSDRGITEAASAEKSDKLSLTQEWKLVVLSDGLIEFSLV